jgi:trans-aconitate methyltransferase
MQSKAELEDWYQDKDPWGYKTNPDDQKRKEKILAAIPKKKYKRALDIGAGEGFITKDLPAAEIHAIEVSDKAAKRLPRNVKRVKQPEGKYDLILATGVLYKQYDYETMLKWIKDHASGVVVTCNIKDWEIPLDLGESKDTTFKYRDYEQMLRVFKW